MGETCKQHNCQSVCFQCLSILTLKNWTNDQIRTNNRIKEHSMWKLFITFALNWMIWFRGQFHRISKVQLIIIDIEAGQTYILFGWSSNEIHTQNNTNSCTNFSRLKTFCPQLLDIESFNKIKKSHSRNRREFY